MAAYQANGARLGWLLLPETRGVEVWHASGEPQRLEGLAVLAVLDGEPEPPALRLDLAEMWAD